ncbi:MAG: alanine--tRNA ligase [bacterium]|nr:alanine--tRNA ligase [bacterium]
MTHQEIRTKFLKFFEERGHKIVPSSSLLPDDPSVLFTTAGMQQFKKYYTGEADAMKDFGSLNTASIQKSMRTSDIDEVGDDSHLTFFEMLGNFSFGQYWKKEAIQYGYDFIVKELKMSLDRITVSIFKGDSETPEDRESLDIWKSLGIPDAQIILGERKDNFWGPTGNKGPCGPTTEIYIDGIEIWNIVFNEYFCDEENGKKHFVPLATKGIDTGMGLERLAMIMQGKTNIFETDLFTPIITEVRGKNLYDYEKNKPSERIIADHLRAGIFLISDGVLPSNTEQGYILRRLLRRAIRHINLLNIPDDIYKRILHVLAYSIYGNIYPELVRKEENIIEVIETERNKFTATLGRGLKEFAGLIENHQQANEKNISGKEAFGLYSTFGFPIELIEELAKENDVTVDVSDFQKETEEHRAKSRAGIEKKFGGHGLLLDTGELKAGNEEELKQVTRLHTATHLLHASLRKVLGENVHQAGSDITAERLRFDFNFDRKMTPEEIKKVEDIANDAVGQDLPVVMREMPYEEAVHLGALSFFKEKYPAVVKVYTVGKEATSTEPAEVFSRELCGGPHVTHTGEIGKIKIKKEEAVGAGVRRIRATLVDKN